MTISHDLDPGRLAAVAAKTHNGKIIFAGGGTAKPTVTATVTGGGRTMEGAEQALAAIETYVEPDDNGGQKVGWRWSPRRSSGWWGKVDFEIVAPSSLGLQVETHNGDVSIEHVVGDLGAVSHNGSITASDVSGNVNLESHNGRLEATSSGGSLSCLAHNGSVDVTYHGQNINVITHNGPVHAVIADTTEIGGAIRSHNGAITVVMGEPTSTDLRCVSHRGRIRCSAPVEVLGESKRSMTARMGNGGPRLLLETHNGGISVKNPG
jgi:hypothetical protein